MGKHHCHKVALGYDEVLLKKKKHQLCRCLMSNNRNIEIFRSEKKECIALNIEWQMEKIPSTELVENVRKQICMIKYFSTPCLSNISTFCSCSSSSFPNCIQPTHFFPSYISPFYDFDIAKTFSTKLPSMQDYKLIYQLHSSSTDASLCRKRV